MESNEPIVADSQQHESIASGGSSSKVGIFSTVMVLIVLDLPIAGRIFPGDSFGRQVDREVVYWVLAVLLLAYVLLVERRPLSSIGWTRPNWKTGVFAVAAAGTMISGIAAIYLIVFPALGLPASESQLSNLLLTPLWFRMLLVVRAAVFEEVYYRGFAIERLTELSGRRWVAALISVAAFTLAHLSYWGVAHLLIAAFGGAVLTVLYVARRDLACNMLAHFFTDAVGFLVG